MTTAAQGQFQMLLLNPITSVVWSHIIVFIPSHNLLSHEKLHLKHSLSIRRNVHTSSACNVGEIQKSNRCHKQNLSSRIVVFNASNFNLQKWICFIACNYELVINLYIRQSVYIEIYVSTGGNIIIGFQFSIWSEKLDLVEKPRTSDHYFRLCRRDILSRSCMSSF